MTGPSNEARREDVVKRLEAAHALLEACTADVTPEIASRGTEWSVADLLVHMNSSFYQGMARRILEEDSPQFDGFDAQARWRRTVEQVQGRVDEVLGIATGLTAEQMGRVGYRSGEPLTVVEALEQAAAHFEEHLFQLRDEVRPREGLPSESA